MLSCPCFLVNFTERHAHSTNYNTIFVTAKGFSDPLYPLLYFSNNLEFQPHDCCFEAWIGGVTKMCKVRDLDMGLQKFSLMANCALASL